MVSSATDDLNMPGAVLADGGRAPTKLLARADGAGLSLGDTVLEVGREMEFWDLQQFESCHCVDGAVELESCADGVTETVRAGGVVSLRGAEPVRIRALQTSRLIFTFAGGRPSAAAEWRDG